MRAIDRLREWAKQGPTCRVTADESLFLAQVELYASRGVGYGWMQQVIEWEWQDFCERMGFPGGAWGPEYFNRRIAELEAANAELVAACEEAAGILEAVRIALATFSLPEPQRAVMAGDIGRVVAQIDAALSRVTPPPEG